MTQGFGDLHEARVTNARHDAGLQSVLLGANTPLEGRPLAAERAGVDAIVLAGAVD